MPNKTLLGPAQVAAYVSAPDALDQVLATFNKALTTPSAYVWSDEEHGTYYRIHCAVNLGLEQARRLLTICQVAGWRNVKLICSPGAVLALLSMDGDRHWQSSYDDEPLTP